MIKFLVLLSVASFLFGIAWAMNTMSDIAEVVMLTTLYYVAIYGLTYHQVKLVMKLFKAKRLKDAERLRPSLASSDLSH